MTFSSVQTKYLVHLFTMIASGKLDHQNIKGSIWISSSEFQSVIGPDYKVILKEFFYVADDTYVLPSKNQKGICKAYRPTETFYAFVQQAIEKNPEAIATRKLRKGTQYYFEEINLKALDGIINAGLNFCKNKEDLITARLLRLACDLNGINAVSYRRNNGCKGRQFATSISLQTMPKYIRFAIINNVTDIDMVNCHPVLIKAFMHKAAPDITTLAIDEYISNRETILENIQNFYKVERKAAKELLLMVGYGASISNINGAFGEWVDKNKAKLKIKGLTMENEPFLIKYQAEMKQAKTSLLALPEAQEFVSGNQNRSLALFVQSVEDEVLQMIEGWMNWKGIEVSTLMFDGIMIKGSVTQSDISNIEKNINKFLHERYSLDIDMKLSQKYYV